MSIGDKWANLGMGAMDKEASFKLLDAFFDAGGECPVPILFIQVSNGSMQGITLTPLTISTSLKVC